MTISLPKILVAMTRDRVIGRQGRLPWHLPEELRLFRELTWGGTVIMGRQTFSSLPAPLAGRDNLVVSTTLPATPGIQVVPNLSAALAAAAALRHPTFIIGGAQLYREALPQVDELLISWIAGDFPGEVRFPPLFAADWKAVEQRHYPNFKHIRYQRRKNPDASLEASGPELQPPA